MTQHPLNTDASGAPTPHTPITQLHLQAAVIVAAEKLHARSRRVRRTATDDDGGQAVSDFLNALIVRGMMAYAPLLLELERAAGIVETLGADDVILLRKGVAAELGALADALAALELVAPDRATGRMAVGAIRDAAAIVAVSD